jgi:hypothetical protein
MNYVYHNSAAKILFSYDIVILTTFFLKYSSHYIVLENKNPFHHLDKKDFRF